MAGDNFWIYISAIPRMQQCSINIVSLNEHMALNLNEYMFLKQKHILEWIEFPWMNIFRWTRIYFLERIDTVPWNEYISVSEYNCLELLYFLWINTCYLKESIFPWQLTSISFPWSWINTIPWSCINIQLLDVKQCLECKYILFNLSTCISWILYHLQTQPWSTLNGHANKYKLWFISSLRNLRAETSCIPRKTVTSCIPTKNVYVSLRQIRHYHWNLLFYLH